MIYDTIGWKRNLCLPVFISGGTPDPEHPGGYDMKYSDLSHVWKEIYKAEWESVCRGSKAIAAMITDENGEIISSGRNRIAEQDILNGSCTRKSKRSAAWMWRSIRLSNPIRCTRRWNRARCASERW